MATKKTGTPKKAAPAKQATPQKAAAPKKATSNKNVAPNKAATKPAPAEAKKPAAPPIKPSSDALARRKVSAEQRHQMIAAMAYQRWQDRGCLHGFAEQDWTESERIVDKSLAGK